MKIKKMVCCDFCHTQYEYSDNNVANMDEHEKSCNRNPINRNCRSCRHFSTFYEYPQCAIEEDNHFYVWDDDLSCEKWEANR